MSEEESWDTAEEEGGFAEEMPEDFYAAEELMLGALSKCRGGKRKRKMIDRILEELGRARGASGEEQCDATG